MCLNTDIHNTQRKTDTIKNRMDTSTIILGDFTIPLSVIDRTSSQKISKNSVLTN